MRRYNMTVVKGNQSTEDIVTDLSKYNDDDYRLENLENYTCIEDSSIPIIESLIPCGSVIVQEAYGAPELPYGCNTLETKYSGDSINLEATPDNGIFPYTVRFWRKIGGTGGTYIQIGDDHLPITEGDTVTESYMLSDFDLSHATGDTTAGTPMIDDLGIIIEPFDGLTPLAPSRIRVAVTVADSCPVGPNTCMSYCDVALGCVAPTCNFTVL